MTGPIRGKVDVSPFNGPYLDKTFLIVLGDGISDASQSHFFNGEGHHVEAVGSILDERRWKKDGSRGAALILFSIQS